MSIYLEKIKDETVKSKYQTWYVNIISAALSRETQHIHHEKHHIFPKAFCSTPEARDKDNIVTLSLREHFVVHLLLFKMFEGERKYKMGWAVHRFSKKIKNFNSRSFETLRLVHKNNLTGRKKSKEEVELIKTRVKKDWEGNIERRTQASITLKETRANKPGSNVTFTPEVRKAISDGVLKSWENNLERRKTTSLRATEYTNLHREEISNRTKALHEAGVFKAAMDEYWTQENREKRSNDLKSRWADTAWRETTLNSRSIKREKSPDKIFAIFGFIVVGFKTLKEAAKTAGLSEQRFGVLAKEPIFLHKGVLWFR